MRSVPRAWLPMLFALASLAACDRERRERPPIVLITLDTTRADHLRCYGYARDTSPSLDRLAADGAIFTQAYAVTSWTLPSHASLFTGKFPTAHGAQYDPEGPLSIVQGLDAGQVGAGWDRYRVRPLSEHEITLAGILARQGYATGGVGGGPWLKRVFGLANGFASFDDAEIGSINGRGAESVTKAALEFVDRHRDEPFFLFLNYYDPHPPYVQHPRHLQALVPPGEDPSSWVPLEQQRLLYDAEIRFMDHQIGLVLDRLRELELYDDAWVIAIADHGRLMGERYLGEGELSGHGHSLSQAEIAIPYIVKFPRGEGPRGRIDTPVQQIDVLPMILARLGLPLPPDVQGSNPIDGSSARPVEHPIVAEVYPIEEIAHEQQVDWRASGDWRALIQPPFKLHWSSGGRHALVDLARDPSELGAPLEGEAERASRMRDALTRYIDSLPKPRETSQGGAIDPATADALKKLGYLGDE